MNLKLIHIPIFRVLIPIVIGIVLQFNYDVSLSYEAAMVFVTASVLILVLTISYKNVFNFMSPLLFIVLGYGLAHVNSLQKVMPVNVTETEVQRKKDEIIYFSTIQSVKPAKNGLQAIANVFSVQADSNFIVDYRHYVYIADSEMKMSPGDTLIYRGYEKDLSKEYYAPWEFDFSHYLKKHYTNYSLYLKVEDILYHNSYGGIYLNSYALTQQQRISNYIRQKVGDKKNSSIIISILLGNKSYMEEDVEEQFRKSGLMHIMAVSGLHVGIIYSCIIYIAGLFLRNVKLRKFAGLSALLVTWAFIFICGLPPSACRAGWMLTLYTIGKILSPRSQSLNLLAAAALLQVISDPYVIFRLGFQYSYIAVAGIMFFYQPVLKFLSQFALPGLVLQSISISIAAQLSIAPLCMYYFGYFPLWFWLTSLIAIPLTSVLLWLGLALIAGMWLPEIISDFIATCLGWVSEAIYYTSHLTTFLPLEGFVFYLDFWQMVACLAIALLLLLFRLSKKIKYSGYSMAFMALPIVFFTVSSGKSTMRENYYLTSGDKGVSLIAIHKLKAHHYFNRDTITNDNELYSQLKQKLQISKVERDENEHVSVCVDSTCISLMSSGKYDSGYVIVDLAFDKDKEKLLNKKAIYILGNRLSKSSYFRWKKFMEDEGLRYEDLRHGTLLLPITH